MPESKRTRVIITSLERQGSVVRKTGTNGWFAKLPDGSTLTIHNSESDHRAEKNTRSRVLRAGLTWPFDKD